MALLVFAATTLLLAAQAPLASGKKAATRMITDTCPDQTWNDTGIGGGGIVTALANVSDQGACCTLCHTNYHDECNGWVWGGTSSTDKSYKGYKPHNCAIMATNGPRAHVAGHVSGISKNAPPPPPPPAPPSPPGAPCNADINCSPVASAAHWRCKQHTSALAADNNCHLPGPGTAGNNTCACTADRCTGGPAVPKNASATQYLVIGDSISLGMNSDLTVRPTLFSPVLFLSLSSLSLNTHTRAHTLSVQELRARAWQGPHIPRCAHVP